MQKITNRMVGGITQPVTDEFGRTIHGSKQVRTEDGILEINVPRDRDGEFEPTIIAKHQKEFKGFDDKILSMYSRGMTTREIQGHLKDIYAIDVSPDLISRVTDSV